MGWTVTERGAAFRDAVLSTMATVRSTVGEVSERDLLCFLSLFPIAVVEEMRKVPVSVAIHAALFAGRQMENVDAAIAALTANDARPVRALLARLGFVNVGLITESLRREALTLDLIQGFGDPMRDGFATGGGASTPNLGGGSDYVSPFEAQAPASSNSSSQAGGATTPPATAQGGGTSGPGQAGPGMAIPTATVPPPPGGAQAGQSGSTSDASAGVPDEVFAPPQSQPLADGAYRVKSVAHEGMSLNTVEYVGVSQGI